MRKKGGGPHYGLRCKDYCAGCIVCEGWRFRDEHGRFPCFEEVAPICEEATNARAAAVPAA